MASEATPLTTTGYTRIRIEPEWIVPLNDWVFGPPALKLWEPKLNADMEQELDEGSALNLGQVPEIEFGQRPEDYKPWIDLPFVRRIWGRAYSRLEEQSERLAYDTTPGITKPPLPSAYPWQSPWYMLLHKLFPSEDSFIVISHSQPEPSTFEETILKSNPDPVKLALSKEKTTQSRAAPLKPSTVTDKIFGLLRHDEMVSADLKAADRSDCTSWFDIEIFEARIPLVIVQLKPRWALTYPAARVRAQQEIFHRVRAIGRKFRERPSMAGWAPMPLYAISAFGPNFCVYEVRFSQTAPHFLSQPPVVYISENDPTADTQLPEAWWASMVCGFMGECRLRTMREALKAFHDERFPRNLDDLTFDEPAEDGDVFLAQQAQKPVCQELFFDVEMTTDNS